MAVAILISTTILNVLTILFGAIITAVNISNLVSTKKISSPSGEKPNREEKESEWIEDTFTVPYVEIDVSHIIF